MDSTTKSLVERILSRCKTLAEADLRLKDIVPSRAVRWGLWDAWDARPRCTAGLAKEPIPQEIEEDYANGCVIGEALAVNGKI